MKKKDRIAIRNAVSISLILISVLHIFYESNDSNPACADMLICLVSTGESTTKSCFVLIAVNHARLWLDSVFVAPPVPCKGLFCG